MEDVELNLEEEMVSRNFFHEFTGVCSIELDPEVERYRGDAFDLLRNSFIRVKPVLKENILNPFFIFLPSSYRLIRVVLVSQAEVSRLQKV